MLTSATPVRRWQPVQLGEELRVVVVVGGVRAGVAPGPDAGAAVERVDLEAGIVGDRRQAGLSGAETGLDPGVRLERLAGLVRVVADPEVVEADELSPVELEQLAQLGQLVRRVRGDEQPRRAGSGHRLTVARISVWAANSFSSPDVARSIRPSIAARSNGLPSAVPWTSTNVPASVPTTLKSTSARESSL